MNLRNLFSDPKGFLLSVLYVLPAIIIALSFHECAHAYAAYRLGDPTARNLGRMTLNPMNHLDIFGLLMLVLVGFGWAKPVPVNSRNFSKPRRDEIIVSVAGVITNLLLAFVFLGIWFLLFVGLKLDSEIASRMIANVIQINIALFVFNLIPIPPLDGYHVLQCLLIRRTGPRIFMFLERYGFLILIVLLMTGVLSSVLSFCVSGIISGMEWIYLSIINLFI